MRELVQFSEKYLQFGNTFVEGICMDPTTRTDEIMVGTDRGYVVRVKFQEATTRAARSQRCVVKRCWNTVKARFE